ncbi:MAG: FHA domain-containing protein [Acidobacteriota bacterium]|nr:FHA domain-containing protein [Acidobacteriota bacterium]
MKKVNLYIETGGEKKTFTLEDELSFGRTNLSRVVLDDAGLSRLNTTFFRDEDLIFVVDEKSTNGTFIGGERISGEPRRVFDGDEITIGSETRIRVEIAEDSKIQIPNSKAKDQKLKTETPRPSPQSAAQNPKPKQPPYVLIAAVGFTFVIIFFAVIGLVIASRYEGGTGNSKSKPNQRIIASASIPIRVVDPLGG